MVVVAEGMAVVARVVEGCLARVGGTAACGGACTMGIPLGFMSDGEGL